MFEITLLLNARTYYFVLMIIPAVIWASVSQPVVRGKLILCSTLSENLTS